MVFYMHRFDTPDEGGVAKGCELTGWNDFPAGGYEHRDEDGIQHVRIDAAAKTNGDAGIQRNIKANPGDEYRFTAKVRLKNKTGKAKFRLNIAARRSDHSQIKEFNDSTDEVKAEVQKLSLQALMPAGTSYLSARAKLHTSAPGETAEGEILSMRLERLK